MSLSIRCHKFVTTLTIVNVMDMKRSLKHILAQSGAKAAWSETLVLVIMLLDCTSCTTTDSFSLYVMHKLF